MDKLVENLKKDLETGRQLHKHGFQVAIWENDLVELLAHIERLQSDKAAVIQQAEIQAQEARTQRSIVMDIGKLVGCDKDWEMAEAVKAHIERLEANQVPAEQQAHFGDAAYVDCECITEQDKRLTAVSGFRAGQAFNELCHMIGGNWPDARMQQEAPKAYQLFMELFSGSDEDEIKATQEPHGQTD